MKFNKRARKIKSATAAELGKLEKEYDALMEDVRQMSPAGLLAIAVVGLGVVLYFGSSVLDFIGLVLLLYPLYIFIERGAHREGYFEGYYDMMTKVPGRDESASSKEKSLKE